MAPRRLRSLLRLAVLAATCAAVLLPGPAASGQVASNPMQVDFSFSAVGGKRPPNIVETRIVGKGKFAFDEAPYEGALERADSASGTIVVEYDILTPHPRTVRLTLKVTRATYKGDRTGHGSVAFDVKVIKTDDGDGNAVASCPNGSAGYVSAGQFRTQSAYVLKLASCKIKHGQQAKPGANSRVRVTLTPKCLKARTPAARKPLCAGSSKGTTPKPRGCKLAGTWSQTTTDVGTTSWTITADGKAKETGLGNASGTATLAGSVLTITWTTADAWAGVYRWTLTPTCSGTGTLTFTKGPRAGTVLASTVRGSAP